MARNFGEKDPVQAVQGLSVRLLHTEMARLRKRQLKDQRDKVESAPEFVEMVGNMVRSTATLTGELRKGGKDMRDAGKKMTKDQLKLAFLAFLRECTPPEREALLALAREEAADA